MGKPEYLSYFKTLVEKDKPDQNCKSLSIVLGKNLTKILESNKDNPAFQENNLFKRMLSFARGTSIKAEYILPKNPNFIEFIIDYSGNTEFTYITADIIKKSVNSIDNVHFRKENYNLFFTLSGKVGSKAGRCLTSLFDKIDNKELEAFVTLLKESNQDSNKFSSFEIVTGDLIKHYYNSRRYGSKDNNVDYEGYNVGELTNSCMRYNNCSPHIEFYARNSNISMLILKDGEVIKGRALLWKTTQGFTCIDRIYTTDDTTKALFRAYATKEGFLNVYDRRKGRLFSLKNKEKVPEVQLNYLPINGSFTFPWMDSMNIVDINSKRIYPGVTELEFDKEDHDNTLNNMSAFLKINANGVFILVRSDGELNFDNCVNTRKIVPCFKGGFIDSNKANRVTQYKTYEEDNDFLYDRKEYTIKTLYNTYINKDLFARCFVKACVQDIGDIQIVLKQEAYWSDYLNKYVHQDYIKYDSELDCIFHKDLYSEGIRKEYLFTKQLEKTLFIPDGLQKNIRYHLRNEIPMTVLFKKHAELLKKVYHLDSIDTKVNYAIFGIREDNFLVLDEYNSLIEVPAYMIREIYIPTIGSKPLNILPKVDLLTLMKGINEN
jgi:hypothetical protein